MRPAVLAPMVFSLVTDMDKLVVVDSGEAPAVGTTKAVALSTDRKANVQTAKEKFIISKTSQQRRLGNQSIKGNVRLYDTVPRE